jgi:SAM-dependent methyltransferase
MSGKKKGTFSPGWDDAFATREWGRYPPEPIVRFVARSFYRRPDRSAVKILDVGCGTGCVTWYVAREGFGAFGIDGSRTGLALARKRFAAEGLRGAFVQGDFTLGLPFPGESFDATLDNAALCHNPPGALSRALVEIHRVLKPGGRHFGMMFAPGSTGEGEGRRVARNTFAGIEDGPLAGPWPVLFADKKQLRKLFAPFDSLELDRQAYTDRGGDVRVKHWLVTARKAP